MSVNNNLIWEFKISKNMVEHMDQNELSLFINSLEDSIEEICGNYDVEISEYVEA